MNTIPLDIEIVYVNKPMEKHKEKKKSIIQEDNMNNNEAKEKNEQECIICLDSKNVYDENALVPYVEELNHELFIKNCACIYNVHPLCIMNWIETNPNCPMCRMNIDIPYAPTNNINDPGIIILNTNINEINDNVNITYTNETIIAPPANVIRPTVVRHRSNNRYSRRHHVKIECMDWIIKNVTYVFFFAIILSVIFTLVQL